LINGATTLFLSQIPLRLQRLRTGREILENWQICPLCWNRASKAFQRVIVEIAKTLNMRQKKYSQFIKIGEIEKQPSRNARKLIAVEIAKTVGIHQEKHSQFLKTDEPVKQPSRNGRKLIAAEIAKTVGTNQEEHSQLKKTRETVK